MKRYIVTGCPGAGKTAILEELAARGYAVVREAATDVIARAPARGSDEPWREPSFVDDIVALQRLRQEAPVPPGTMVQLYDRSPVCTLALARYLGQPPSPVLLNDVDRLVRDGFFEPWVFFVRPIGLMAPTAARRITYEQSLRFETIHEEVYRERGFTLVDIPRASVQERAAMVMSYLDGTLPA